MKFQVQLKPVMFVGTASDVGKSVITTGFCRIFRQDGYFPAPFKAQNMSLNSYATPEGLEIGRAQAVQAEAAGIDCHTDMNPVLLKPTTDRVSQVILNGKPAGNQTAREYFLSSDRAALFAEVTAAYNRLASRFNPVVLEGAGSISELNLKHRDITNLRMARFAGAVTYLVTDIDRGGIFASLYGTMALLDPEERQCIRGIIINKFRGDPELFSEGRAMIESLCGVPVIGIVPYFRDIFIEQEDAVALSRKKNSPEQGKINIAVVLLNRLSNFTDFDCLERDVRVNLYYTADETDVRQADIIILPGTKNTIEDLLALKTSGLAEAITTAYASGKTVVGICGGYQMMGLLIEDPLQVESAQGEISGLGILPVKTVLKAEKTTRRQTFKFRDASDTCTGYEIHAGETEAVEKHEPLVFLSGGHPEGIFLSGKCWGTYLHGILDNQVVIDSLLEPYALAQKSAFSYTAFREQQYDKLAALFRQHLDVAQVYGHLSN